VTEYSGVGYTDIDTQEYIYVSEGEDSKLTYNLGANPFLQYGTASVRKQRALNILNKLKLIKYVPFKTAYLNTPAYDLGDLIQNNGGIADESLCCIMWYEYSFSGGYSVEGFGQNPALATARNKVDKELAGIMSRTDKNSIQFYTFKNAEERVIGDGESEQIINIRFTTQESKQATFQAEILCDADVTLDELEAQIEYYLDGALIDDYKPTETWSEDGKHIISLYYVVTVEPNTLYRWQVLLNSNGGTLTIPAECARGTIWGQGLVATNKWDGYIDVEDTIGLIDITRRIGFISFTDDLEVWTDIPYTADGEETVGLIDITRRIDFIEFEDYVLVDKESLYFDGYTWGDIDELQWAEVEERFTW
jgi:hypothetical protein